MSIKMIRSLLSRRNVLFLVLGVTLAISFALERSESSENVIWHIDDMSVLDIEDALQVATKPFNWSLVLGSRYDSNALWSRT